MEEENQITENKKIDMFFGALDYYIDSGIPPRDALRQTAEDYADIFFNRDSMGHRTKPVSDLS